MNVELKPRPSSIPMLIPANDNAVRRLEVGSPRRRAVIYKPAKSAMTSGRARTKQWLLKFEPRSAPFIEPLMGWTGSSDPLAQIRLAFPSRESAIAYAKRQGLDWEVRGPQERITSDLTRAGEWPAATPASNVSELSARVAAREADIASRAAQAA